MRIRGLTASIVLVSTTMASSVAAQQVLSRQVQARLAAAPAETSHLVWVFFRDKGPQPERRLDQARGRLTPRALARRAGRGTRRPLVGFEDLTLPPAYVEAVRAVGARLRHESRWFGAVSIEATEPQIRSLARLPFVARVDLVRRQPRRPRPTLVPSEAVAPLALQPASPHTFDYGASYGQLAQIGVPAVHDLGYHGEGVVVAVLDAGFDNLAHEVFASARILAAQDFVNHDADVADGADLGEGTHGTATLSALGGFREGQLVGPAFGASFILAKTENTQSETPVEEDNWAAAAEWVEALGADIISSSLGYFEYDNAADSYEYADLNGDIAISTRAADLAGERGVVVVNSAGNEGFSAEHGTLGAPADGQLVLAVGAVGSQGDRASFSSVGPTADGRIKPDLMAQGRLVVLAESYATNAYGRGDGTSFACPLVAGVAALVLQAHPEYGVEQVSSVLRSTASNAAAPNNLLGWGIVNALQAVLAQQTQGQE